MGVKTVTQEYRPSKRVEDQEAGPVGGPWAASLSATWPVRGQPPQVGHIAPYIDKIFDIEEKTSMSLYLDIAPISCKTSKFLLSISLYPDIAILYLTRS
jgi:hypothetical protein